MNKTAIQWADKTWNPTTGCEKVSPGCDNCYAERFAERWRGIPGHAYEQGFDLKLHPDRLLDVVRLKRPARIFVNSMSDLFHHDIPDAFIDQVFAVMGGSPIHTFQVLTKRPERMRRYFRRLTTERMLVALETLNLDALRLPGTLPYPNIWLGVSTESNRYAWRVDVLRMIPAAVRFISFEPLLAPVDQVDLTGIDWAIVGGESGPGWRPMDFAWARDVRNRCLHNRTAFFMKQAAASRPTEEMIPPDLRIRAFPEPVAA